MIFIEDKGRMRSLKEIAKKYNVPTRLVRSRYNRGIREIEKLTEKKYEMLKK